MQADGKNPAKDIDIFWDAFEKSFEQTTSHWHFIDQYLSDFRQEPDESTADLDLCIRGACKGVQVSRGPSREVTGWSYCFMPLISLSFMNTL